jgi:hypothetical protein
LCRSALSEDSFILSTMREQDIFVYQRISQEREYFRICFETLADGCRRAIALNGRATGISLNLDCSEEFLDRVFGIPRSNRKSTGPVDAEDVFAAWPEIFQASLLAQLRLQGGKDAIERYRAFGYQLPATVLRAFDGPPPAAARLPARSKRASPHEASLAAMRVTDRSAAGPSEPIDRGSGLAAELRQLLALIDAERATRAEQRQKSDRRFDDERKAFNERILEHQQTLEAERAAFIERIAALEAQRGNDHGLFSDQLAAIERREAMSARFSASGSRHSKSIYRRSARLL